MSPERPRGVFAELVGDLVGLRENNLYRSPEILSSGNSSVIRIQGRDFLNFSSNNYLGLAVNPRVVRAASAASKKWGAGSGASRLISGGLGIHDELERELASFKKEEAALVYTSGYMANVGAVTALLNEKDLVLVDRLNHASLIDAARLCRAQLRVYPHRDMAALEKILDKAAGFRRKMVLTDAYFSMDGDVAPLDELHRICVKKDALLLVDEAHSTGVFGRSGRGLTEQFGLQGKIDVVMGTLSKALGSSGGFIAGKAVLKDYLINRSREFIYTTAPVPAASGAALESLRILRTNGKLRKKLWENVSHLREGLEKLGCDLMGSEGPIVPILIGDTAKALRVREYLRKEGIFAPVIRPPTVSKGTDRIRLSLTAAHETRHIEKVLAVLKKIKERFL